MRKMKIVTNHFIRVCFMFFLANSLIVGCIAKVEADVVTIDTTDISNYNSSDDVIYGTGHIQSLAISGEYADTCPQLADAVMEHCTLKKEQSFSEFQTICDEAKKAYFENNRSYIALLESDLQVTRADEIVFSFLEYSKEYRGGTHEAYGYIGHNYNAKTGEELSLEEIVDDTDGFRSALYEALIVKYEHLGEDAIIPNTNKVCFDTELDNFRWVMDQGGIYIIFNTYCLGSFAEGVFHVYLTFSDYPGMFSGQFLNNSKVWFEQNDVWFEH